MPARLEQRPNSRIILGPAHAEGDHSQVVGTHHAKGYAFEVGGLRLLGQEFLRHLIGFGLLARFKEAVLQAQA
jgi:hypothetical protein